MKKTRVERVAKLWGRLRPHIPPLGDVRVCLTPNLHTLMADEALHTWIERSNAIYSGCYSRRRDQKRAWKRIDLRIAQILDAAVTEGV